MDNNNEQQELLQRIRGLEAEVELLEATLDRIGQRLEIVLDMLANRTDELLDRSYILGQRMDRGMDALAARIEEILDWSYSRR